jgi:glycine/D-amino acid oxidase-like deaminating enzyme
MIQENDISCEWKSVSGACHTFFSRRLFNEAKAEVITLKKESPVLGSLVDIVEDKGALASLRVPKAVGAITQSKVAKLAPYKLVTWVLETLIKQSSLNLQTTTPVDSVSAVDNKWSVNTPRGSVETPHVLLATNGYTGLLLPQFESLIVPVQGEMSALTPTRTLEQHPLDYTYAFLGEFAMHSMQDDYLIQRPSEMGGQLMFGGGRALAKGAGIGTDQDDSVDPAAARYLRTMLTRYLNIIDDGNAEQSSHRGSKVGTNTLSGLAPEAEWTGVMGFSRDGLPWVGGLPDKEGLWLCGGYTGHGELVRFVRGDAA